MSLQRNRFSVPLFAAALKVAGWLQTLPNKVTPPSFRLVQIGSAFWQSRALYVAARLDVATLLGAAPLSAEEIAARLSAQPDAVYRLLRMLAAMGIFAEISPRVFANNKLSEPLRTDRPRSVRAMILMHNSEAMSRPWYEQLEEGVRRGEPPFRLAHGQDLFDYMDTHPELDALFAEAMDSIEALSGDGFVTDFAWNRFDRVIDVGGSKGSKSLAILKRYPNLKALVVDRAQVVAGAPDHWAGREPPELLARLRFQAGDLLESVPAATSERDIYLLSAVFHGMADEECLQGLHSLANACGTTGARIAILEMVMPEVGADLAAASFDMQMFMGTRGRERTLAEWARLLEQAGLALEEVVGTRSFASLLVAKRP